MSQINVAKEATAPVVSELTAVAQQWERHFSQMETEGVIYDYIIVGSDLVGAVLANRYCPRCVMNGFYSLKLTEQIHMMKHLNCGCSE